MTIWILALVLLVFCALLGHKQGAIRAAISFFGIILAALLAWPLSGPVSRLLRLATNNSIVVWMLAPLVVFVGVMFVVKWIGFFVHRKVWVYYQYDRDELRMARWERLNKRMGAAVALLNAFLYLVLISEPIYNLSYWSTQIASSDQEKFPVRLLNRMGNDLETTGMAKIACAIDPAPESYFHMADLAGLISQNPQLAGRLAAYPPFLPLTERTDFQQLAADSDFQNAWETHAPFGQIWNNSNFQYIWKNKDTVNMVWNLCEANLSDLLSYLHTGQSAKYDGEPILGRWDVNVVASLRAVLRTRANVPSSEMAAMRQLWNDAYAKAVLTVASDNEAFLDNFPQFQAPAKNSLAPTFTTVNLQGAWQSDDTYTITLSGGGVNKTATGSIDNGQLTLKISPDTLILNRESH